MKRPFLTVLFFIGLGAILLGLNLGFIDLGETSWIKLLIPAILIVNGASSLDSYTKKNREGIVLLWGLFTFIFGILLTLGVLDLFDFRYGDWLKLWPIILVAFGLHQLFKKTTKKKKGKTIIHTNWNADDDSPKKKRRPIEALQFKEQDWEVVPMNRVVNIGSFFFDFSKANIPLGETSIYLSGNVGDVKILVADHVAIDVTFKSNVLSTDIFDKKENGLRSEVEYRTPGYEDAERRIKFVVDYHVLDAKIKRV
ncbi:MAG: cell wall-active antibiotics response protein LiaF [Paenisporosarcina sp.]